MSASQHAFGWRPDTPDQRDYLFALTAAMAKAAPARVDLTPLMPPVLDQGNLGSCTANAIASALEFDRRKQGLADYVPSRLMIYYLERELEGTINSDAGAEIRDGMKVMAKYGACKETLWPYVVSKFKTKPSKACYASALENQALIYERVALTQTAIESVVASGFPIVIGFAVYESFESNAVAKTGTVPMPKKNEQMLGGHCVLIVGYDRASKRVICRNSWGASWGSKGMFTLPYAYVTNSNLVDDFWVIRSVG